MQLRDEAGEGNPGGGGWRQSALRATGGEHATEHQSEGRGELGGELGTIEGKRASEWEKGCSERGQGSLTVCRRKTRMRASRVGVR